MHCKIIVTNSDVRLIKIRFRGSWDSFRVSASNGSLRTKEKSKSKPLKVSASIYGTECVNAEFVWEFKQSRAAACIVVSFAAVVWACHATRFLKGGSALRDEPKRRLRRRLLVLVITLFGTFSSDGISHGFASGAHWSSQQSWSCECVSVLFRWIGGVC